MKPPPLPPLLLASLGMLCLISPVRGAPAPVWHEPAYLSPEIQDAGTNRTMRDPAYEMPTDGVVIYQGFAKNYGANGNQTGGKVHYRFVPRTGSPSAWASVDLSWMRDVGANQYWKATVPFASAAPSDIIEYYLEVNFDGSGSPPPSNPTYLHGGDLKDNFLKSTSEAAARAAPYSLRNRPGWIFHANNRSIAGNDIQVRLKSGYIAPDNDPATLWADQAAIYFTTDGTVPVGALGVPSGTSQSAPMVFDGIEGDASSNGNAAYWRGTMVGVLSGLPVGGQVRYKIGLWHSATGEEKFADHGSGTDNTVFVHQNGQLGDPVLTVNGLNANYTTTKVFVDEIAGDAPPLTILFQPGKANVTAAEVYTNLNRRDRADNDADGDGYDDGISGINGALLVAGDDNHYFKAYTMANAGAGSYSLTLPAEKTGAYRLTARFKVADAIPENGNNPANWIWYTNGAANRRDHAITVSPRDARELVLYEINILNIEASGDTFETRSTIEDMHNADGAPHEANNRWDLDYLQALGANWLWFQPIHPPARDGREPYGGWDTGNPPYEPGSPYAVKNFFEVSPILTKNFSGDPYNNADLLNQTNRDAAMSAWQNFVAAADGKQIGIMLDAPFNHTAFDVELAQAGMDLLRPDGAAGAAWAKTDEIRSREARFFSHNTNYANRASSAATIAAGPDRFDFGKWRDVKDVFFGRYDALVEGDYDPERTSYTSEGDWFDASDSDWTDHDITQGGQPRNVTRRVWQYFARYATYWLEKTRPPGENRNSTTADGDTAARRAWDQRGIDGLRCDFGQGLPPQAWEYIINVARERKWNFVMMSESLDGGAVTYRSNRHFDILNENIVFPLKSASFKDDYRNIFEERRNAYGQGLVLINNVSHDEENYDDPWEALIRYSVACTMDGVPMIFPGQELGASRTSGYNHYEVNFGKTIPHFKRFNSMQPAWSDTNFGNDQLFPVYAGMGAARQFSSALKSSNRWFLGGDGNNPKIHAVAKYEQAGVSLAMQDVVLAFANLDRNIGQADNFKIPGTLATLLGIQDGRTYNVKNIAAYLNSSIGMTGRRDAWLWGSGYTGSQLKTSGFFIALNRVPTSNAAWSTAPFEAQYLKVYDVSALPAPASAPGSLAYALDGSVTFSWPAVTDPGGLLPVYQLTVTRSDGPVQTYQTTNTTYTVVGIPAGVTATATVTTLNPHNTSVASSPTSSSTATLSIPSAGDHDGDGQANAMEDAAGTNPLDSASSFRITAAVGPLASSFDLTWSSVPGKTYRVQASPSLAPSSFIDISEDITATGTSTSYTDTAANEGRKFYRVRVVP